MVGQDRESLIFLTVTVGRILNAYNEYKNRVDEGVLRVKGVFLQKMHGRCLLGLATFFCCLFCSTYPALAGRSETVLSLKKLDDIPLYVMNYSGDYHFKEFLSQGAKDIHELNRFLRMNHLIGSDISDDEQAACSAFTAINESGDVLIGRNYDLTGDPPALLLYTHPSDGYASVSMVNLNTMNTAMMHKANRDVKTNILAAPYFPADGMNEQGVTVAILTVPGASFQHDSAKVSLLRWQMSRLILDYAKDVEEAITLVRRYNVNMTALGTSNHCFVADAAGNSVVFEFINGDMQVIRNQKPWHAVTNFILYNNFGDAGRIRYERLMSVLEKNKGRLSEKDAMELLRSVSLNTTIWSTVYNTGTKKLEMAWRKQYERVRKFGVKPIE